MDRNVTRIHPYFVEAWVSRIIINPNYNPVNFDSDIALLKLNTPVEYNHFVKPICLPARDDVEGKNATVSGNSNIGSTQHSILTK